jgi:SWI/SNF-related matrix-associated actin-dependent regulator of chromatin subfamily A-like protein 1
MLTAEQLTGAQFLASRRVAMLADRVGFGKTAQVVRACDILKADRITVLCPPVLRLNEVRQFELWSQFGYAAHIIRNGKDDVPAHGLVVCSYDLARSDRIKRLLTKRGCDVLVLDEAHRAKTPRSKTTRALFNKAGIASTASRIWFVTGEPTPNHAGEYYVFAKVCGAWAGNHDEFIRHFCVTIETDFGPKIIGTKEDRRAELKALLGPHVLQRDGIDPERAPLTVDDVYVDADIPRLTIADAMALERITNAIVGGDMSLLDDPFVSTMRRLAGLAKAKAVADLVATEQEGGCGPTLIFCQHTGVIDTLADALGAPIVDGRTRPADRQYILDEFQGGRIPVLVAHIRAAGEGLTLTAATRVILAEPAWSPAENTQAIARAWRRGQTRPVHASFVYLPRTIDDAIAGSLRRKSTDIANLRLQPV